MKRLVALLISISFCLGLVCCSSITKTQALGLVKSAVKDVTMDDAKSLAVETIFGVGSSDSSSSLVELFRNSKFKGVVSSEQSIFKKYSKKYLSEVYSLSDYIYIGDRRKNLPYNVNLAWSKYNAVDFEIANYKDGSPYSGTYIAFDSETASLVFGECRKGKLTGYTVILDAYNNTLSFKLKDEFVNLESNNGIYNLDGITISQEFYYDYDVDGNLVEKFDIVYNSPTCSFRGSPFKFNCTYSYSESDSITYDYTALKNIKISQTDGSSGEVRVEDSIENVMLSDCLVELGLKVFSKVCINAVKLGYPPVELLDTVVEIGTGDSLEKHLYNTLDSLVDKVKEMDTNPIDAIGDYIEEKEEKKQKAREEQFERVQKYINFNFN